MNEPSSSGKYNRHCIWLFSYTGATGRKIDVGVVNECKFLSADECYSSVKRVDGITTSYTLVRLHERRRETMVRKFVDFCVQERGIGREGDWSVDGFSADSLNLFEHPSFLALANASGGGCVPRSPGFYSWLETPGLRKGGLLAEFCKLTHGSVFVADSGVASTPTNSITPPTATFHYWILSHDGQQTIDFGFMHAYDKLRVDELYSITTAEGISYTMFRLNVARRESAVRALTEACMLTAGFGKSWTIDGFRSENDALFSHRGFGALAQGCGQGGTFCSWLETAGLRGGGALANYCKKVLNTSFRPDSYTIEEFHRLKASAEPMEVDAVDSGRTVSLEREIQSLRGQIDDMKSRLSHVIGDNVVPVGEDMSVPPAGWEEGGASSVPKPAGWTRPEAYWVDRQYKVAMERLDAEGAMDRAVAERDALKKELDSIKDTVGGKAKAVDSAVRKLRDVQVEKEVVLHELSAMEARFEAASAECAGWRQAMEQLKVEHDREVGDVKAVLQAAQSTCSELALARDALTKDLLSSNHELEVVRGELQAEVGALSRREVVVLRQELDALRVELASSVRLREELASSVRLQEELASSVRLPDELASSVRLQDELDSAIRERDALRPLRDELDYAIRERDALRRERVVGPAVTSSQETVALRRELTTLQSDMALMVKQKDRINQFLHDRVAQLERHLEQARLSAIAAAAAAPPAVVVPRGRGRGGGRGRGRGVA